MHPQVCFTRPTMIITFGFIFSFSIFSCLLAMLGQVHVRGIRAMTTNNTPPPIILNPASGKLLTVGPGMEFATLADALNAAVAGDIVAVKAGTYINDFATVNVPVNIVAVGGLVNEVATIEPPNGKALLLVNASMSIRGFSFSGGNDGSFDGNVAGIRYQAGNMQVEYCDFEHNEDGLLGTPNVVGTGNILIDHCTFADNGTGDGLSHNLYVNEVKSLTVTNSYFHNAIVGHEIKSRAEQTVIEGNVIADGPTGTGSYDIDIPNAGVAVIANNVIEKGPEASNDPAIHYGGETQITYTTNSLTVSGNTIIDNLPTDEGIAVWNDAGGQGLTVNANISNNRFYNFESDRLLVGGPGTLSNNATLSADPGYSTVSPWLSAPLTDVGAGPDVLTLSNAGHTITGGAALLELTDMAGGNTVSGGSGGLDLTETGSDETVTTSAGSTNTLSLTGGECSIVSNGTDSIVADGQYDSVVVNGRASVSGDAYEGFALNGQDSISMLGGGNIVLGDTASVTATVTQNDVYATVTGGASLALTDRRVDGTSVATVTGAGASVTAAGGGILVVAATGAAVRLQAGVLALAGGADTVSFGHGTQSVWGGGGADTYMFDNGVDASTIIQGFRTNADTLGFSGFSGNAIASGRIVGGSTVLTLTDGGTIDLQGVVLNGYGGGDGDTQGGGPNNGTLTGSGQSVAGGASLLSITDIAGGNTISGGSGGLHGTILGGADMLDTAQHSSNRLLLGRQETLSGAGADTVTVQGNYSSVAERAASTVTLSAWGNSVQGGTGLLTVDDLGGGNSISGGAGGLMLSSTQSYDTVSTAAGARDTVSVGGYADVMAAGNDEITASGLYSNITATGTDSIVSDAPGAGFVLDGSDTLSATGDAWVRVGAAAHVAVGAKGAGTVNVAVTAGGHLAMSQAMPGGGISWVSVSGGASSVSGGGGDYAGIDVTTGGGAGVGVKALSGDVTVLAQGADTVWAGVGVVDIRATGTDGVTAYGGAGAVSLIGGAGDDAYVAGSGTADLTLGAGQDSIVFGSGHTTVWGGAGDDVFTAIAGHGGGQDVIAGWAAGDTLNFQGFAGNPVHRDVVHGGSTVLTLTDGSVITLVGVTHYQ